MATSSCHQEEFSCPVCLEILNDPATIPCGHTYCMKCIQKHWDKSAAKGIYSCPQCRQVFKPRPVLGRNNMLMEAMKKLRVQEQERPPACTSDAPSGASGSTSTDPSPQPACPRPDGAEEALEGVPAQAGLYPQLPSTSLNLCPVHQQVLELYCCDDKESVCDECSLLGHKGHRVVLPDEEKQEKQQELGQKKEMIEKNMQTRVKVIQMLPQVFQAHKNVVQGLQRDSMGLFADVLKTVELMNSQVMELFQTYEASSFNHIEAHRFRLHQEISKLNKQQEELNSLANTQDSIQFLNAFLAISGADQLGNAELEISPPEAVDVWIRSALGVFQEELNDLCKRSLANVFRCVNDAGAMAPAVRQAGPAPSILLAASQTPVNDAGAIAPAASIQRAEAGPVPSTLQIGSQITAPQQTPASSNTDTKAKDTTPHSSTPQPPPAAAAAAAAKPAVKVAAAFSEENPAPKTRDEMIKYRFEPTLDPNSAYRHIRLSDGDRKATLRAENQNYPEHADRFLFWRQVMCREPMAGSPYYWEVEWTGQKVTIGVAYKEMPRSPSDDSSRLGHNEQSWTLYWSGTAFSLWHAGKETTLAAPKSRKIGVYLDQQAGLLAFYRVSHNQAHLICCVETEFSAAVYPSFRFWSGVGSTFTVCQLE
ncbi:finTRIM family, member 86 isoform X1 [Astyanax mexicanus]|uniref:finTRIM family, member 86 isoform X1 n=1 Tax=Astyanax mexicanus TaxID=7994 RepID=UPI0020CB0E8C|nr:finTRIM family, member 86 isoform X1 [Astyanax mexicanus]